MELLRLEQEYAAAVDAARRRSVAEQIMMNLDTLRELEAAGKRSKKIDAAEWMRKYAVTALPAGTERVAEAPSGTASVSPTAAPVHADNLEQQVDAISSEPFAPERYAEKKGRIEALMSLLVKARESSTATGLTDLLTRLWEVAVREDDAYDNHRRTTGQI